MAQIKTVNGSKVLELQTLAAHVFGILLSSYQCLETLLQLSFCCCILFLIVVSYLMKIEKELLLQLKKQIKAFLNAPRQNPTIILR